MYFEKCTISELWWNSALLTSQTHVVSDDRQQWDEFEVYCSGVITLDKRRGKIGVVRRRQLKKKVIAIIGDD